MLLKVIYVSLSKLYFLNHAIHVKNSFEKLQFKPTKYLILNADMCAYHVLVFLAQPFAIELSVSHPQEIDYNNCVGNHIHFLALFALVPFIVRIRHKTWLVILI